MKKYGFLFPLLTSILTFLFCFYALGKIDSLVGTIIGLSYFLLNPYLFDFFGNKIRKGESFFSNLLMVIYHFFFLLFLLRFTIDPYFDQLNRIDYFFGHGCFFIFVLLLIRLLLFWENPKPDKTKTDFTLFQLILVGSYFAGQLVFSFSFLTFLAMLLCALAIITFVRDIDTKNTRILVLICVLLCLLQFSFLPLIMLLFVYQNIGLSKMHYGGLF